jgi:ATP-dependent protease HslVU (ClpYQ) peptidase subunit
MSTVVVSRKKGEMSGDTHATDGSSYFNTRKVFYVDGCLIGVIGNAENILAFVDYIKDPQEEPELEGDFQAVILKKDKKLYMYESFNKPIPIMDDWYAIGSGSQVARYIMKKRGTTEDAVKAAMLVDDGTGGTVHTVKL